MIAFFAQLPGWIVEHRGPLAALAAAVAGGAAWAAVAVWRRRREHRVSQTRYGSSSRDPFRRS